MKTIVKYLVSTLVLFLVLRTLTACGTSAGEPNSKYNADGSLKGATPVTAKAVGDASTYLPESAVSVKGGIDSAFDLTVDGKPYSDVEAFYTYEIGVLKQAASENGYEGYTSDFQAQLGLNDLKYGETVYVQAEGGQGFTGSTKVQPDGRFSINVRNTDLAATYAVRANKRISLLLTSPDKKTEIKWCWNYSASQSGVEVGKDVILNTFSTTLTLYACDTTQQGGMTLPANPQGAVPANPNTATATATATTTTEETK